VTVHRLWTKSILIGKNAHSLIYHYTVGAHYDRILAAGLLKPSTAYVCKSERPVVWFTRSDKWDSTANKAYGCEIGGQRAHVGLDENWTHRCFGGLVRMAIDATVAPHDWRAFKRLGGINPRTAKGLYSTALQNGVQPSNWRVSFEPVALSNCIDVDFWNGAHWQEERVDVPSPTNDELQAMIIERCKSGEVYTFV
jgi:hypothetical protein